jgi:hypothetical protein
LDARISPVNEKIQALSYRIEIRYDYFSVGLWWLKTPAEKDFAELLKKREVKVLQADLQRKRHGEVQPPWWFWWECWEGNLYHDDDPWSWFVKERDEAWYKDKATKFWGFVGETHALVMEANKALKQFK